MGLFDTVKVCKKLPTDALLKKFLGKDFDPRTLEFQTKDLDCAMANYEIRDNGYLYTENVVYRESTPEELEQDKKESKKYRFGYFPRLRVESREWVKTDVTKDVEFYSYCKQKDGRYYSTDYLAHVVKGKVKSIKLKKTERESDQEYADRLKTEAKWAEDIRLHNELTSRLSYKIVNNIYNKPMRKLIRVGVKYSQKVPIFLYNLEKKILY